VADLKPVYLVHGDDDARIDEWRSRLRTRAEAEQGAGALEAFDARASAPGEVAAALATLTFATGTRYLLVEDAGAWKPGDLEPLLEALASMPPETVLVIVVRGKPLKDLTKAVQAAGGDTREYAAPKPWEVPRWVAKRASDAGLRLDGEAAKLLVGIVGTGQQRLAREIEKIAIAVHPQTVVTPEDVEELAAGETAPKVYSLADAVVAGEAQDAIAIAQQLVAQGSRANSFVLPVANRLREVRQVIGLLDSGMAEKDLAGAMKQPPWKVKKTVALARRADRETLERGICRFAELELELRGGSSLDEDTAVTLALMRAAA
jgi:DNA polymerase III subunit delta